MSATSAYLIMTPKMPSKSQCPEKREAAYFVDEEYLVTALVPSETACLASSPGRISRTLYNSVSREAHRCNGKVGSRCLDFSGRDGRLLIVGSQLGRLSGNSLEYVVDERVEDGHSAVGDTSVRVDLLED
jgi:hypothetical protein